MTGLFDTALISALIIATAPVAKAEHPSIAACGGAHLNSEEGTRQNSAISEALENRIEQFLQRADASPGVSIAIVKDDQIIYARGYGFRNLATCDKAESDTRYYLKSTTKSFTGMMAAILHEEGAIELDAPISDYLPDLKLPAPLNPDQISLRSHFTHTQPYFDAGLNYRTAFPGNLADSELVSHVNEYSIIGDIKFRYSNFGPIMGAHAIGQHTGFSWRDLIPEKVFEPAGMQNSFTSITRAANGPLATAYIGAERDDYTETPTKTDNQMHAAGGSVSTVADLGRWIILNLNQGVIDGKQVIARRAVEQAQARQVQLRQRFSELDRFAHGLGLHSADYDGDLLLHHFGGETHVSFMPEHKIGIAILANEIGFGSRLTHSLAATIYDAMLGKSDLDARMERRLTEISDAKLELAKRYDGYVEQLSGRVADGKNLFSSAVLTGHYVNARLGEMRVVENDQGLSVTFGALGGALRPAGADAYLAYIGAWGAPPELFVFRDDAEHGFIFDWGGRIFQRD